MHFRIFRTFFQRLSLQDSLAAAIVFLSLTGSVSLAWAGEPQPAELKKPLYEAQALLYVNVAQPIATNLIGSQIVWREKQMFRANLRTLLTRPVLQTIAQTTDAGQQAITAGVFNQHVDQILSRFSISLAPGGATQQPDIVRICFADSDPKQAEAILDEMFKLILAAGKNAEQKDLTATEAQLRQQWADEKVPEVREQLGETLAWIVAERLMQTEENSNLIRMTVLETAQIRGKLEDADKPSENCSARGKLTQLEHLY